MTGHEYSELKRKVIEAGYFDEVDWAECQVGRRPTVREFWREAVYVICNSGMKHEVAVKIFEKVMLALESGKREALNAAIGHDGKRSGILEIWIGARRFRDQFLVATDKLKFLADLPWIGPITKYHLAKNLGLDVAKPDRHVQRLADHEGISVEKFCNMISILTGDPVAVIDLVLWRASKLGLIGGE